jgi:acetyl esterase/lipase
MEPIRLWPGVAPGSESWTHEEAVWHDDAGDAQVCNVVVPTITSFLPEPGTANGTAVIVAPGGGFFYLAETHEGTEAATWLAGLGITAFLLRYRLIHTGPTHADFQQYMQDWFMRLLSSDDVAARSGEQVAPEVAPLAFADGEQAVRVVRARAAEWAIAPDRIGFMGFSAGGFVTSAVAQSDDLEARPNFVAPIYGAQAKSPVPDDAPPLFCVVATDDGLCVDGCIDTVQAWRAAGRPAELHSYTSGGHGFGMRKKGLPLDTWPARLADWMQSLGYLEVR